jgi:hypothetical protein
LTCLAAGIALAGLAGCGAKVNLLGSPVAAEPETPHSNPDPRPKKPEPPKSTLQAGSALPTEQASAAASFTDSVGVVTHLSYTDTAYYTDFPQVLSALETLGVHHIRDGYYPWQASSPIVQAHQQLAAAGIKCDYVVPYDQTTAPQAIEQFAPMVGDMESLEAPNECDISGGCGGMGASAVANVVAFLPTVTSAAQDLGMPMLGPSFVLQSSYAEAGNLDADMTENNLHIYFGGRNPGSAGWGADDAEGNSYGSFNWWLDQAAIDGPGLKSVITETGYVASAATTTPYTVPDSVEASYTPRTLLLSYKNQFQKTYLYELLDEVSSPGYGLLNADLSPKPAFTAVQNLLATLSDDGQTFTPGSLPLAISGGDSNLMHLLLQKSDGSYWLALWLEEPSWDPVNVAPIQVTPENIGIELGNGFASTTDYQFDSNGNVTQFDQPMNGNSTALTVTDQVSIVRIAQQ